MSRYLVLLHPGDPVPNRLKIVDDATWPPRAWDDGPSVGVSVGSLWIDTAAHQVWLCVDASAGAAVWTELGTGPASRASGPLLIASEHATPLVFEDLLQDSEGGDLLYASEP